MNTELLRNFGLFDLEACFPLAYNCLPETYKNETYISFYIDDYGNLCAKRGLNKEYIFIDSIWEEFPK
jgi:hypothetical protein